MIRLAIIGLGAVTRNIHLPAYARLKNSLRPEVSEDFAKEVAAFTQAIGPGMEAAKNNQEGKPHDEQVLNRLLEPLQHYEIVSRMALPLIVPPVNPKANPKAAPTPVTPATPKAPATPAAATAASPGPAANARRM